MLQHHACECTLQDAVGNQNIVPLTRHPEQSLHFLQVLHRWGILPDLQNPSSPWLINIGLISCGPRTGIAIVAGLAPVLSRITKEQLRQLPTVCRVAYPTAKAIALAGRLPGLVKSAGAEVTPPLVDGLAGTVFAMEETSRFACNCLRGSRVNSASASC